MSECHVFKFPCFPIRKTFRERVGSGTGGSKECLRSLQRSKDTEKGLSRVKSFMWYKIRLTPYCILEKEKDHKEPLTKEQEKVDEVLR